MRVCQFRHFGTLRSAQIRSAPRLASSILAERPERCQTSPGRPGTARLFCILPPAARRLYTGARWFRRFRGCSNEMGNSPKIPLDVSTKLRTLAHDLSNAIETVMQAGYLLGQAKLDGDTRKWVSLIDNASRDAARINREIRDILRANSE